MPNGNVTVKLRIHDHHKERANKMCTDFLTSLNAASSTIETNYLANGAQGVIYTCETDDSSFTGASQNPPVPNKSGKNNFRNNQQMWMIVYEPWYG